MVKRLVRDNELKSEWKSIKKQSINFLSDRNVLVHGEAWNRENSEIVQFMRYSVFSKDDKEMDFEDIVEATPKFFNYAERITRFAVSLNAHLAMRIVPDLPPVGP